LNASAADAIGSVSAAPKDWAVSSIIFPFAVN
jgi:hypothetical protein